MTPSADANCEKCYNSRRVQRGNDKNVHEHIKLDGCTLGYVGCWRVRFKLQRARAMAIAAMVDGCAMNSMKFFVPGRPRRTCMVRGSLWRL